MNPLACLLLGATLAVPAGEPRVAPKDLDKLQGVWKVTAATLRGATLPAERLQLPTYTLVVVGNRYVFMTHAGTLTLDPAKGTMDCDVKGGRYKGTALPARYELKDDTLKLILPSSLQNPMPVPEPKAGEDPAGVVYTLQRDGKATKDQAEALLKDHTAALPDKVPAGFGGGNPIGGGAKGGGFGGAMPAAATQQLLERILERLERIEQRLDAMEKKLAAPREQK